MVGQCKYYYCILRCFSCCCGRTNEADDVDVAHAARTSLASLSVSASFLVYFRQRARSKFDSLSPFCWRCRRRRGEGERDGRARDFSSNASCKVRVLISTEKRNGRRTDGNHAARRTDGRTDHDGDEAASGPSNLKSSGGPPPPRREHGSAPTTNTVSAASNRTVKVKSSKSKKQV